MQAHLSHSLMLNTRLSLRFATPGPQPRHGGRRWRPRGRSHPPPGPAEPSPARAAPASRAGSGQNWVPRAPLSPLPAAARVKAGAPLPRPGPGRYSCHTHLPARRAPGPRAAPSAPAPALPGDRFRHREKRPLSVGRSRYHVRETNSVRTPRPPSLLRATPAVGGWAGVGRAPGAAIFVRGSARRSG